MMCSCMGKRSSLLNTDSTIEVYIVVREHVDSNKSTLNGHLVYQLNRITEQEMRRPTKSASPDASDIALLLRFLAGDNA
jgi:translation elongation factor EF-1alpha